VTAVELSPLPSDRRAALERRVRRLVAATITYNVVEAFVAITAGIGASSAALVGFGLDSTIEVASATAVAWQFTGPNIVARERTALRVIAISFFLLATYVVFDATRSLLGATEAEHSTPGLVLAALSLAIMPVLSMAQRRTGQELGSLSAVADSKQTLLCTYLSAVLLAGLALNSLFGWSWADPIAALVIAGLAVREGREAWRGETCCDMPLTTTAGSCADECCSPPERKRRSMRTPIPSTVRAAISAELDAASAPPDAAHRWTALERAHILSQPWPLPHTSVHWRMLTLALRQRDRAEALGQIVRLVVATPGSVSGRYPRGNTGRARVGLTEPMALPRDLEQLLQTPAT
jgi:hypothetical protein